MEGLTLPLLLLHNCRKKENKASQVTVVTLGICSPTSAPIRENPRAAEGS